MVNKGVKENVYRVGDIAEVQTGPFGSQLHQSDYVPVGTPIITVEHLDENRILHSDLPRVSEEDKLRLSKYSLKKGDIVFSRVGSVDRRAYVSDAEDGWLFSGRCLRVRVYNSEIDSRWLSYYFGLHTFKEYVRGIAVGATMPSLNTSLLSNIEIVGVPPLPEQRAIAKILSDLDEKIELNNQMNRTLEAIAQALFKRWFVDFEFPNSGWQKDDLGKYLDFVKGRKPRKISDVYLDGYKPQLLIENLDGSNPLYADEDGMSTVKWDEPIMIMDGASSGRVEIGHEGILGSTLAKIVSTSERISNMFLYYFLKTKQDDINHNTTGTSIPHTDKERIRKYECFLPPSDLLKTFDSIALLILNKIIINKKENKNLSQIRDSLLPKLLSGKIRIGGMN